MVRRQAGIRHVRTVDVIVGGIRPGPGAAAFQPLVHSLLTTVSAGSNQEKSDKDPGSRRPLPQSYCCVYGRAWIT
ncbi:hypothetical protein ACFWMU_31215 [Streptomyces sp. NPDC058357]|uniref:hypothetical protein n=1 Tax=unclassified Streptomyces TaxID=2593676 RepID=UPI003661D84B